MAAGLGYKEFTTGDVLTAADANGYLASQVVMVFASAAARTSAIASPQEGMISYLKDTNSTEYYSGSAWVAVGAGATPKVLQVVQGTLATAATTTSGTLTDTGLSVSITPSSATSKILVISSVMASKSDGAHSAYFTILRDSTNLVVPTSPGSRIARICQIPGDITGMQYYMSTLNWTWLDSPASTSALTYKVQYNVNGGTGCINRTFWDSDLAGAARGVSTITVMEISA